MLVPDRMFRVVVLGGIALVATPGAGLVAAGCGGSVTTSPEAGAEGGFPAETASFVDTGTTEAAPEASTDGATDGSNASDACFPQETALSLDAACGR